MNAWHKLALIGAGIALMVPQVAAAAPVPNAKLWSGTWKLNLAKSKFTAPDASSIHCIDLRKGTMLWKETKGAGDLYLGGVYGGKVLIVHAYDPPRGWIGSPDYQRILSTPRARRGAARRGGGGSGARFSEAETDLIRGRPADAIVAAAKAHDAKEIVLGSRGLGLGLSGDR